MANAPQAGWIHHLRLSFPVFCARINLTPNYTCNYTISGAAHNQQASFTASPRRAVLSPSQRGDPFGWQAIKTVFNGRWLITHFSQFTSQFETLKKILLTQWTSYSVWHGQFGSWFNRWSPLSALSGVKATPNSSLHPCFKARDSVSHSSRGLISSSPITRWRLAHAALSRSR